MDSKAFTAEAINGYEDVLHPPRMVQVECSVLPRSSGGVSVFPFASQDVSYWLNRGAEERLGSRALCTGKAGRAMRCRPCAVLVYVWWQRRFSQTRCLCSDDLGGGEYLRRQTCCATKAGVLTPHRFVGKDLIAHRRARAREQDQFVRDHITENDFLIVSVGGNDVAVRVCVCVLSPPLGRCVSRC